MKTIIIVGGGKSVKESIGKGLWETIKGQDIITCNNAVMHIPYAPKIAVWLDSTEKDPEVIDKILDTDCLRVTQLHHDQREDEKVIRFDVSRSPDNFDGKLKHEPPILFVGKRMFTGIFAMSLSLYMGYDKMYLLGFDWGGCVKDKNDEVEWWGATKHWKGTDMNIYRDGEGARDDCAEHHDPFIGKADIINVSPNSLIPSFPKITYEQFFKEINEYKEAMRESVESPESVGNRVLACQ